MRFPVSLVIVVSMTLGCAPTSRPPTPPAQQAAADACSVPTDIRRFSISVANHSGRPVSAELREKIARALAHAWGEDERTPIRDWPTYLRVMRELGARIPDRPFHTHQKWRVREGDSAVALLTYRPGAVPELDIPQQQIRKEFRGWITTAVGRATARALNGRTGAPLPLQFEGAGNAEVTLEVRFGRSPRPDAAIAAFALQEREVRPRPGNRGPRYPDSYRVQNLEGQVMIGFIIDEAGQVDGSSMRVLWSDGDLFTQSVVAALPSMRFHPFVIECVPYPIVAIQPFNYTLTR
jgi:hypothetical protein